MEVIFISHKYPPSIGGMQKQSFELIKGYASYDKAHKIVPGSNESKVSFFWNLRSQVQKLIDDHPNVKLIHCNDGVCGFLALQLLRGIEIPVVVTFHGLDLLWPNRLYQNWLKSGGLQRYAGIIGVSEFTAQEAIKRGADANKVSVVLNGVDDPDWSIDKVRPEIRNYIQDLSLLKKKLIVSIGRPVKRKGFNWFIQRVLPLLHDEAHYIIIGPKAKRGKFHELIRKVTPKALLNQVDLFWGSNSAQNKLEALQNHGSYNKRFDWLDDLNYHELQYVLSEATLSVMPNISVDGDAEGFGLVSLEANMLGTYVIASDVDGIPSAVRDTYNGSLLPSGEEKIWVQKINQFLFLSPEELSKIEKEAKHYVQRTFSWSKMAEEYAQFFERINKSEVRLPVHP